VDTARTVNSLLGYPPDARLLILNVDDFGMCHSMNVAALRMFREGVATSTTLMAPCPWAVHAMALLKENPDIHFGVHLTAISEQPRYRWGPLSSHDTVPTLVDRDGFFPSEDVIKEFIARVKLAELEKEFRKQIETVLGAVLHPTHLDSHCDVHVRRDDIFQMVKGLAKEYGLALRVSGSQFSNALVGEGYAVNTHDVLDSTKVELSKKRDTYVRLLRELPAGLSEWALHPGVSDAELEAVTPSWQARAKDLEFFTSKEAHQVIKEEGIVLLGYEPLQKLWKARGQKR
jgi:predicted glycoside hydrolase/deacetylase ChbG (UPF0249 family)